MKRTGSLTFVVGVATAVAAISLLGGSHPRQEAAVAADVPTTTNGIVVDGTGIVSGTPDVLRVVLGVSVHRGDVSTALEAANSRQTRLRNSLRKHGVADKDLQTSDVSVYPSYDNHGRPNGYQVSETLTAKLRNLRTAGQVISDAVQAGGDEATVQGVSFALEDNAALLAQARDAAYQDALGKAERYAHLSGRSLGQVEMITEGAPSTPPTPMPMYDQAGATALKAVPINPGTSDVSVSVTIRWALK